MKINAQDIQKLRQKTSAGVIDCKQALEKSKGNFEQAIQLLKEKGIALAQKKSTRAVKEGRIEAYVHLHNKIGVLVEINCETDFVARNDEFKHLAKNVAMQIAALNPQYVNKEDVPEDIVAENKKCIDDFYRAQCLMAQAFVKDQTKTVKDYLTETIAKIGENIVIRRFVRFQLGEE